ncbi:Uncharacterised protein [Serratia rubidaea]|uniref:Uncharacterized protein n=1 Tax=Serratia rubidaea TaxID=61652 RepID=A0A447QEV0_SERRU|nr:Uncharacterised protein [Serratia rubidaea]
MSKYLQQPLTLSRRRFLTGATALAAAPLLAGLWPKSALAQAISQALPQFTALRQAQKGILTGAHWAPLRPSYRMAKWSASSRSKTIPTRTN